MSTLKTERAMSVMSVQFSDDSMTVRLDDGRSLSVPLAWYPRLLHGTQAEREKYELIGGGEGIHWPELDEDLSVEGLLAGPALCRIRRFARQVDGEKGANAKRDKGLGSFLTSPLRRKRLPDPLSPNVGGRMRAAATGEMHAAVRVGEKAAGRQDCPIRT